MSDGPYKTLPMGPKWRALAQRAHNAAFTDEEVAQGVCPTLKADWNESVSLRVQSEVQRALCATACSLFPEQATGDLQALRGTVASTFEAMLIESGMEALRESRTGLDGLEWAVADALIEKGLRGIRQVEEHGIRRSAQRAAVTRSRLESALSGAPIAGLARSLVRKEGAHSASTQRQDGLDDGVSLGN